MAPILKQQEEALPKPYSSCGPSTQSSRGAQWRDHQGHKPCVAKAGLSSKSYTEWLLKQPFFSSPVPETFLSGCSLTLNFPSEQTCPHCAYSPHPQPHSRACLKLCQIGRGSACLQGGVPAYPRESKTNRAGRSWEQREAKQSWCCIASLLNENICCLIQLNRISPCSNQMDRCPCGCLIMNTKKTSRETCPEGC